MTPSSIVIIGDSVKANAFGRALSMAMTASVIAPTEVLAVADGPTWVGHSQFLGEWSTSTFRALNWRQVARTLRERALTEEIVVWLSKGTYPLNRIAAYLARNSRATVLADFDDDDVAIMKSFVAQSVKNRLKMPAFRRKSPWRLQKAQREMFSVSHGVTFSSPTLRGHYFDKYFDREIESAVVPHTRSDAAVPDRADGRSLRLGFFGTIRPHKGVSHILALMRSSSEIEVYSFEQSWQPPEDVKDRWHALAPSTPLDTAYAAVDFLVLPMSASDPASLHQLPAKLVDAARAGCPIVATPTPVLQDFSKGAYVSVEDWTGVGDIIAAMNAADRGALGRDIRAVFDERFSMAATSSALMGLLSQLGDRDLKASDAAATDPESSNS